MFGWYLVKVEVLSLMVVFWGGFLCLYVEIGFSSDVCDDCDVFEVWMGVEI